MSDHANEHSLTIDGLARAADVATSTVRMYQHRGLLAPPEKRGRVGYYGEAHLARLQLIGTLQDRGFSLAGIKELVAGLDRGESLGAVLGLGVTTSGGSTWASEQPAELSLAEFAERLPLDQFTSEMAQRVVALGLIDLIDGDRVVVRSPEFLRIGSELAALGLPLAVIVEQYEQLSKEADIIAGRFTELFREYLWDPAAGAGLATDEIAGLMGALERLGPLAESVVLATLRQAIQGRADRFAAEAAEALAVDVPRPGAR